MKNWIDILGIALPLLIILLGMVRLFTEKRKWINALTLAAAFLLLITGVLRFLLFGGSSRPDNPEERPVPLKISAKSTIFQNKLDQIMTGYYELADELRNPGIDSTTIDSLKNSLMSLPIEDLKTDTLIYETAIQPLTNLTGLLEQFKVTSQEGKYQIFDDISNELLTFLSAVRYNTAPFFWMECENAFGEANAGNWISKSEVSKNPYSADSNCVEMKTKIDFQSERTKAL